MRPVAREPPNRPSRCSRCSRGPELLPRDEIPAWKSVEICWWHVYISIYIYIHTVYIDIYIIHLFIDLSSSNSRVIMYIYIYHIIHLFIDLSSSNSRVIMYIYIYILYKYIYIYINIYIYIHIYIYNIHTPHTSTHIHTQSFYLIQISGVQPEWRARGAKCETLMDGVTMFHPISHSKCFFI